MKRRSLFHRCAPTFARAVRRAAESAARRRIGLRLRVRVAPGARRYRRHPRHRGRAMVEQRQPCAAARAPQVCERRMTTKALLQGARLKDARHDDPDVHIATPPLWRLQRMTDIQRGRDPRMSPLRQRSAWSVTVNQNSLRSRLNSEAAMRRILVSTLGQSPAVLTETVWRLAKDEPSWRPDAIVVITTRDGAREIGPVLLDAGGPLAGLLASETPTVTLRIPRGDGGEDAVVTGTFGDKTAQNELATLLKDKSTLRDVADGEQARAMGAAIYRSVAEAVCDPTSELHLSVAGGRKTMSAHALMAFTMLGREQDRASHVLVKPPGAETKGFWHPDQGGDIKVRTAEGAFETIRASEVTVTLVDIPAPIMRDLLPKDAGLAELDFDAVTRRLALTRAFAREPLVELDEETNTVRVGGWPCRLQGPEFAMLALACRARCERWPGVGPGGYGAEQQGWLSWRHIVLGRTPDGVPILERMIEARARALGVTRWSYLISEDKDVRGWRIAHARANAAGDEAARSAENLQLNISSHFASAMTRLRAKLVKAFGKRIATTLLAPSRETEAAQMPSDSSRPINRGDIRFGTDLPPEAIDFVGRG